MQIVREKFDYGAERKGREQYIQQWQKKILRIKELGTSQ